MNVIYNIYAIGRCNTHSDTNLLAINPRKINTMGIVPEIDIAEIGFYLGTLHYGCWVIMNKNKENLRDLIYATGLVTLLKIGFKSSIFGPCNLEIWWMNWKNKQ